MFKQCLTPTTLNTCINLNLQPIVLTLAFCLGFNNASFLAAASMELAAPNNSVSAITVGSSGSTQSEPKKTTSNQNRLEENLTHNVLQSPR